MIPENLSAWGIAANVFGSIAILLALTAIPVVRRYFGARLAFLLWFVVLVRLLVPVFPTAPLASLPRESSPVVVSVQWLEGSMELPAVAEEPPSPSVRAEREEAGVVAGDPEPPNAPVRRSPAISWMGVWLAGVMVLAALTAWSVVRGWGIRHRATDVTSLVRRRVPELPYRLRVLTSDEVRGPALHGLWSSVILLPAGWSPPEEEFRCVLLHEIGHFRRGDLWWRWAFVVARTIHWFNPLVWWADRVSRHDQELACDEWVLAKTSAEARNYAESILSVTRMLGRRGSPVAVLMPMAESAKGIERRLRNLCAGRGMGRWGIAFTGLIVTALVFGLGPLRVKAEPTLLDTVTPPGGMGESEPNSAKTGGEQIQIEAKVLEVPLELADEWFAKVSGESREFPGPPGVLSNQEFQELIRWIGNRTGGDVTALSLPRVLVNSGQRGIINVIREFRYPTEFEPPNDSLTVSKPSMFETRNIGVTVALEAVLGPGDEIDLTVSFEVLTLLGFVHYAEEMPDLRGSEDPLQAFMRETPSAENGINQPIFEMRATKVSLSMRPGQIVMLGGMLGQSVGPDYGTNPEVSKTDEPRRLLYVFLTARRMTAEEVERQRKEAREKAEKDASALQSPPANRGSDGMLYGIPVPEKPGFVTSPYAPTEGYVDVRGFPRETEVKCPYSQKIFLVP